VLTNSIHVNHDEASPYHSSLLAHCSSPDYIVAYFVDDDEILAAFGDIVDTGPYIIPKDSNDDTIRNLRFR